MKQKEEETGRAIGYESEPNPQDYLIAIREGIFWQES